MKRTRLVVLTLMGLVGAAVLLQPARGRSNSPEAEGRVVVRYWEKWSGHEASQMQEIVDWFNSTVGKEKGIWVAYTSMSTVDQKTLVSTAAGLPPDVAGLWDTQIAQFASMNALEPLSKMADAKGLTRSVYKPVFYDTCCYEGELYALPSTPAIVALIYNKALFRAKADELRKAGFDPEKPPATIDELNRYAAILDTRDASGKLIRAGYLPQEPGWWNMLTPIWFGGKMYDPKTRRVLLLEPEAIASFEWLEKLSKQMGVDQMRQFKAGLSTSFDSPQSPFFTGDVAMEQEGTWKANYISQNAPKMGNKAGYSPEELKKLTREQLRENADWGAAPFPSAVPGVRDAALGNQDILCIPSTSKHKKEAFEFIAFVNRRDVTEKLASMHCKDSPLLDVSREFIEKNPNPYIEVFEKLAASPNARGVPSIPVWPEIAAELLVASDKVLLGQATGREALEEAQKVSQAAVDRFFARQDLRKGVAQ